MSIFSALTLPSGGVCGASKKRVRVRMMRGWKLSIAQSEGGASQHYPGSHKPFTGTAAALKPLRLRCCLSDGERTISSPFDFDWMVHLNRKFGANFRYILSSDFTFIRLVVKQCAVLYLWTSRHLFLFLILVLHCQYQLWLLVKSWSIRWCVVLWAHSDWDTLHLSKIFCYVSNVWFVTVDIVWMSPALVLLLWSW